MEVICYLYLWVWSFQYRPAGALNDLNRSEVSSTFCVALSGTFPPVLPNFSNNDKDFTW